MSVHQRTRGFTLIELLVVIAIIGILSSIILASLNTARSKAEDASRISNVKSLETAVELYYDDHNTYPPVWGPVNLSNSTKLSTYLVPKYISVIPEDLKKDNDAYGGGISYYVFLVHTKAHGWCKTGVNVHPAWWGTTPMCNF